MHQEMMHAQEEREFVVDLLHIEGNIGRNLQAL
jgi:hypothetical protein